MILTGPEIVRQMRRGRIEITPYDEKRINPNSYNLRLHSKLLIVDEGVLDMKEKTSFRETEIPEEGFLLEPGHLYLGRTYEKTRTEDFVPMIEGRSSVGRLGISIHATAGFGDIGFNGFWTLEISVIQPVVVYPLVDICQIFYVKAKGKKIPYVGKYQLNEDIQVSGLYKEFDKKQ